MYEMKTLPNILLNKINNWWNFQFDRLINRYHGQTLFPIPCSPFFLSFIVIRLGKFFFHFNFNSLQVWFFFSFKKVEINQFTKWKKKPNKNWNGSSIEEMEPRTNSKNFRKQKKNEKFQHFVIISFWRNIHSECFFFCSWTKKKEIIQQM